MAPAAAGGRLRLPPPPEAAAAEVPATDPTRTRPDTGERCWARPAAVSWATPVPGARARVSLCMIVKDEEAHLGACLASARDLVDEMLVVDTGSADRTKEVAASFGARVYDFAWVDSFAAARNESLRHATGDWVFWLDADERLDEENRGQLRTLLAGLRGQNVGYLMSQRSVIGEEGGPAYGADQVRLFPRHPAVRWQYRVHEQILPAVRRQGGKAQRTPIVIQHVGYQDAAVRYRKHQRNLGPLQLDHAEHPDNAFILFNLGWTYKELGQHAAAASCLRQCLERARPQDTFCRKLYALLTQLHRRTGKKGQALAACRAGRALYPDDIELGYQEAMLLCEAGDLAGAEACLVRLLEAPPKSYIAIGVDPALRGYRARYTLGVVCRDQGKPVEAERQWRAVLAERPEHVAARMGLVELWLAHGRGQEAEEMAAELEREAGRQVDAALVRAKVLAARQDCATARGLLEETIAKAPQALWPRLVHSQVLLQEGRDPAGTERALRDVLALDPHHAQTQSNLALLLKKQGHGRHAGAVAR